jgi:tetratricopeptide (TPR) repeat protein
MGEVWLGHDRRLSRDVALKVIRPDLFENPTVRERFVREARHASSVVHPYVATVFDVVEHEGETILVMEFVQGRDLKDVVLEERPPTIQERLRYGIEIAEALEAIHAKGILHRDLKPGNVLITQAGHVKVLDFGLARTPRLAPPADSPELADTTGLSITAPGIAVGTISYMSPEQIRGDTLDKRSDLFSLGIVLCELATTHHPFLRDSMPKTVSAILEAEPFSEESGTDTIVPAALQPVLARTLSKVRDHRYSSAGVVAEELQAVLRGETTRVARESAQRRQRRVAAALAAVVLVSTLAAIGVASWLRQPPVWTSPRIAVAVAPLEDKTGLPDGAVRAAMVADLIATDLAASRIVRPIGPNETRAVLDGLPDGASGQEVAQRLAGAFSVDYVMRGVLYREGDKFLATLEAVPARGGAALASLHAEGATAASVADALAGSLRRALPGVTRFNAIRDDRVDLVELTSKSEDARLLYERALLAWRDGKITETIDLLDKAIAVDSGFVLARATLAQVRHEAGYGRLAREEADRARLLAPKGDSAAAQRLRLTLDAVRAEVSEDGAAFAEAAGRLAERYGDEPEILQLHAKALNRAGKTTEALAAIDRAIGVDPSRPSLHLTRAEALSGMEAWDKALVSIETAAGIYQKLGSIEGRANAECLRGGMLLEAQRHDEAIASLTRAIEQFEKAGRENLIARAASELGGVYLMIGRPGQAEPLFASAVARARSAGNLGLACGTVARQGAQAFIQADYARAEAYLRDAIDQARQLQNDGLLLDPLSNLTSLLSFIGRYADARTSADMLLEAVTRAGQPERIVDARLNVANLDLMQGRLEESKRAYDDVLRLEADAPLNQNTPWARLARAELFQLQGRLQDALADADAAVADFERLKALGFAGYARLRRGLVGTELGRLEDASTDLVLADREARRDEAGLADLAARVEIARWLISGSGRLSKHAKAATEASPVLRAWSLAAECESAVARGDAKRAEATCRRAFDDVAAQMGDAVAARAARAEALVRLRRFSEARDDAQRAYDQAAKLGMLLPLARAAAVMAELPEDVRPASIEAVRTSGRGALDSYLSAVPSIDRERIGRRPAIARLRRLLASGPHQTGKSPIRPPEGGVGVVS